MQTLCAAPEPRWVPVASAPAWWSLLQSWLIEDGRKSWLELRRRVLRPRMKAAVPTRRPSKVVDLGSVKAARMTLQPGWRWSECIKPVVGTESCQTHHVGAVTSGELADPPR